VLAAARLARPSVARTAGLELAVADGRSLPYDDGVFDVAHASMVIHHLDPADAVAFLRELRRVARLGIVVNDLVRGRLFWIGGGPAGAATAIGLARRRRDVVLVERAPAWHWRACGVFTSPLTVTALDRLGLDPGTLAACVRRTPAMRVESAAGTRFRLTYGDD